MKEFIKALAAIAKLLFWLAMIPAYVIAFFAMLCAPTYIKAEPHGTLYHIFYGGK